MLTQWPNKTELMWVWEQVVFFYTAIYKHTCKLTRAVIWGCPDRGDGGSSWGGVGPLSVSLYCWGRAYKVILGVTILQNKHTETKKIFVTAQTKTPIFSCRSTLLFSCSIIQRCVQKGSTVTSLSETEPAVISVCFIGAMKYYIWQELLVLL